MCSKKSFLIFVLFAFLGIQSISADPLYIDGKRILFQGSADGPHTEFTWESVITPNVDLPTLLDQNTTFGILYVASDDGGDGIYHDAGIEFTLTYNGSGRIVYPVPYRGDYDEDDGEIIQYSLDYDGFEILQTATGLYMRNSWVGYGNTNHVAFMIYK